MLVLAPGTAAGGESVIEKRRPATQIRLVSDGDRPVYELTGPIEAGAQYDFEDLIGTRMGGVLMLESDGGDAYAAMDIGRLIRQHKIETAAVKGRCLSGCAVIWAAGVKRYKDKRVDVGFHHPWHLEGGMVIWDYDTGMEGYYKSLGYNDDAIAHFMVNPQTFWYVRRDEAAALGLKVYYRN